MTRSEMISILKELAAEDFGYPLGNDAIQMAIQALSQEPCDDAISREMALKECHDIVIEGERYRVIQEETLLGLPPIAEVMKREE